MENKTNGIITSHDENFCFNIFHRVSRSFSTVTEILEQPLRTSVCIFYLILRVLDTIEDDVELNESMKAKVLETFTIFLSESTSRPVVCDFPFKPKCKKSYVELAENFDKVLNVFFSRFTVDAKKVVRDVVNEMASGMIKYSARSIETLEEYNEYCYYVAGLVGVGLTKLFQLNGDLRVEERISHVRLEHLAVSTGVFLQKANILQDIYEDLSQPAGRSFYPKEVWQNYVRSDRDLIDGNYREQAIACLNQLINDAFQHLPDSIELLSLATQKSIFRFTAIPQCVAVGTLEKMFNNPAVFSSHVTINNAEKAYIKENVVDMASCLRVLESYLHKCSMRAELLNVSCNKETKNWILESVKCVCNYKI